MKTEKILEHAEVAATYFRALVANGVPVEAAISMTSSYILTVAFRDDRNQPPREPWEGE